MTTKIDLTADKLRSVVRYEPETGRFYFLKDIGARARQGREAGCASGHYYWLVGIGGKQYARAHLAWLYMTGKPPELFIDHINRDPLDDRWSNLRLATKAQNTRNTDGRCDNTSGHRGVSFHKKSKLWHARICFEQKPIWLGEFKTKAEAAAAYMAKAKELDPIFYGAR